MLDHGFPVYPEQWLGLKVAHRGESRTRPAHEDDYAHSAIKLPRLVYDSTPDFSHTSAYFSDVITVSTTIPCFFMYAMYFGISCGRPHRSGHTSASLYPACFNFLNECVSSGKCVLTSTQTQEKRPARRSACSIGSLSEYLIATRPRTWGISPCAALKINGNSTSSRNQSLILYLTTVSITKRSMPASLMFKIISGHFFEAATFMYFSKSSPLPGSWLRYYLPVLGLCRISISTPNRLSIRRNCCILFTLCSVTSAIVYFTFCSFLRCFSDSMFVMMLTLTFEIVFAWSPLFLMCFSMNLWAARMSARSG